jgi:hypothetical protein
MGAAFAWGVVAASSLVLGGIVALTIPIHRRVLGLVMAFAGTRRTFGGGAAQTRSAGDFSAERDRHMLIAIRQRRKGEP